MALYSYTRQDCKYIEQALTYYLELLQRQMIATLDYEEINDIKLLIQKTQDNITHYEMRISMIDPYQISHYFKK